MSNTQRIEAVRDYLRGLKYQGEKTSRGATPTDFLAGLHMRGMAEVLLGTADEDVAGLLAAGRRLDDARRGGTL